MIDMKIKYNKKSLPLFIFIVVILLLDYHFFYLFKYPQLMGQYFSGNYLHVLLSVISFMMVVLIMRNEFAKQVSAFVFFKKYCVAIYWGWCLIVFYSIVIYPSQNLIQTITEGAYILIIPLAVSVLYYFYKDNGTENLFNVLNLFFFIYCIIIIIQRVVYQKTGVLILDFDTYMGEEIKIKSYGVRLGIRPLGNIMLIYNFSVLVDKEKGIKLLKKIFTICLFVLGAYCVIFLQQTRMYIIADAIAMVVIYILNWGKGLTARKLGMIIVLIVALFTYINTESFKNLLFSFSTNINNETYASTAIRLDACIYYIRCFLKNPLLGNGFARAEYYYYVEHGFRAGWYYYYSDTGLIGILANMGLYGAYIYLRPLCRMVKTTFDLLKKDRTHEENFFVGLCAWMIATSISLILVGKNGIIAFVIILAFSEYIREKNVSQII